MVVGRCCRFMMHYCGLIFIVLALTLYHPVHENAEQQTLMRVAGAVDNFVKYMGMFCEVLGRNPWPTERRGYDWLAYLMGAPLEEGIQERHDVFSGVKVQIFEPAAQPAQPRPAFIFVHGGGFTFGSPDTHRNIADLLAKRLQGVVVSVDYRMTPEVYYPEPLNDVLTVVRYVHENAQQLGINPNNMGIGGDSAGGNLAAATCLKLRDTSSPVHLKYQVLIYPWTQALTLELPAHHKNDYHAPHFLKKRSVAQFIAMYMGTDISSSTAIMAGNHTSPEIWKDLGHLVDPKLLPSKYIPKTYKMSEFGANRLEEKTSVFPAETMEVLRDPYAWPLMAESFRGLPRAFVMTCELDPLRDDGLFLVDRLKQDGVTVEHYHDKHGFHGMMSACKGTVVFQAAVDAIDAIVNFVQNVD